MTSSMHAAPVVIGPSGEPTLLQRQKRAKAPATGPMPLTERALQELIHRHPAVIPMQHVEPAYMPLIPVCMELPTPSGDIDNVWVTPAGGIVLGECKLIKNPQARREVLAQALDYAQAVCRWSLEELEKHVGQVLKKADFRLWNLVRDASHIEAESDPDTGLDEASFNDSVQRRLKAGQVMVLIVGDGITEGAETLTSFLQLHAGFHAGLALVDLSVWDLPDGQRLVVPRVPMKTVLVERGIVKIDGSGRLSIEPPKKDGDVKDTTPSEAEFMEQLGSRRPGLVDGVRDIAQRVSALGVTPEFGRSLILRVSPTPEWRGSAGYIDSYGTVWFADSFSIADKLGIPDAARRYLQAIASASGGTVKEAAWKYWPNVLGPSGKTINLDELLPHREQWMKALERFTSELADAAKAKDV